MKANEQSQHRVIRAATEADLDALVDLEEQCFSAPWSRKSFQVELQGNPFSHILVVPGLREPPNTPLLASICVWVVFEEIRFLNLAVHPQFRKQGLATRLVLEALRIGGDGGCRRGMLEVRHSNQAARSLYHALNFKEYATRKSYYTNPTEDAILMVLEPITQTFFEPTGPQRTRSDEDGKARAIHH